MTADKYLGNLRRLRQGDYRLEVILSYVVKSWLKNIKTSKKLNIMKILNYKTDWSSKQGLGYSPALAI